MSVEFDPIVAQQILSEILTRAQAQIYRTGAEKPFNVQRHDFDLSVARSAENPFVIGYPFRSVFVVTATDATTEISFRPITTDSFQSAIPMKLNSKYGMDYPINKGFVHWSAQAGKTLSIIVIVDGLFESGSLISQLQGSLALKTGTVATKSIVTLGAAAEGVIFAANGSRNLGRFQNTTGASIWVGPTPVSNTGADLGIEVPTMGTFEWTNAAELRGYSVGGGSFPKIEES